MARTVLRWSGLASVLALALVAVAAAPSRTPVVAAQVPDCLTGTWTLADNSAFAQNMNTIFSSAGAGLEAREITGDIKMIIAPDGSFELQHNRYSVALGSGLVSGALVFDGSVRGILRETEPGMLGGSITESNVAITLSLLGMTTNIPFDVTLGELEPQAYTCDGERMNVSIKVSNSLNIQLAVTRAG